MKKKLLYFLSDYLPFFIELYSKYVVFFARREKLANKISIINTHDQGGGAAKIAYDILKESKYLEEIQLYVHQKKTLNKAVVEIVEKSKNKFQLWIDEMARLRGWLDFSKISPLQLLKDSFFRKSKIIHLHNLHGDYFSYGILKSLLNQKHVIWTLHDEQLITGHCSCTLNCPKWITGCGECPNLSTYPAIKIDNTKKIAEYKVKLLQKLDPIIICPSSWLAERVKLRYPFLSSIQVIQNGIDTEIFKPRDKIKLRQEFGLPENGFLILFAAELSTKNPFKGGDIINQLLNTQRSENEFIVTIGGKIESQSDNHISFDYISEETQMAKLYAMSDLLIYPTKADNLPLVVLEAMSCGTPVIASSIGGISEIIKDKENGFLISEYHTLHKFQESIEEYKKYSETEKYKFSDSARKTILNNYTKEKMVASYDALYMYCFSKNFK